MGSAHAQAYHDHPGFEIVGLVARGTQAKEALAEHLGGIPTFSDYRAAMQETIPDAVSINTYPDTHEEIALFALEQGAHTFIEKPIAMTVEGATRIRELARTKNLKIVVGYILRQHPSWLKFIELSHTLGKPLVLRMNLNQQSYGDLWRVHKNLMKSMSPIVDCGVHYVDIMCQMTKSKPISVYATGANLSEEIAEEMYNYGMLQVKFEDGSVGWYESGWGPMVSKTAYFVKDIIGPKGSVSIVEPIQHGESIEEHVKTSKIVLHHKKEDLPDEYFNTLEEPDHQELCRREQDYFYKAITEDMDLSSHLDDAINSLKIVLAADESVRNGKIVNL